jgi:hypothetical protein
MLHTFATGARVVGRVVAAVIAAIAFYFALFLYEDEEKQWQNRLDSLWVAIYDRARLTTSTTTALINTIAAAYSNFLDRLFGRRLLSLQAVSFSLNLSLTGLFAALIVGNWIFPSPANDPMPLKGFLILLVWFGFSAMLAATSSGIWSRLYSLMPILLIAFVMTFGLLSHGKGHNTDPSVRLMYSQLPFLLGLSLLSDCLAIIILRKLVSFIRTAVSSSRIAVMCLSVIAFCALITVVPVRIAAHLSDIPRAVVNRPLGLLLAMNVPTILFCLLPVALLSFVLIHRLTWPLVSRLIYPVTRHNIFMNRKIMVGIGAVCLTVTFNLEHYAFKELVKLFS